MYASVGCFGEKNDEYREMKSYWVSRLCQDGDIQRPKKFDYVLNFVFGGVHYPDLSGNWFLARHIQTTVITLTERHTYSNNSQLPFLGPVFDVELGEVMRTHKKRK
jgi:hypothetical protein